MDNDDQLRKDIENVFTEAWQKAPKIGGLNDLGEHIARAIKDITHKNRGNYQNLIRGAITIFDETDEQEANKGALELEIMTASSSPINKMLEHYKPKLRANEFIAVMTDNDHGQLTLIAFANGCKLTTLTTDDDDIIGVSDYEHTEKMFRESGDTETLLRIFDRLIEIATK